MPEHPMRFLSPEETLRLRDREIISRDEVHVWPISLIGLDESRAALASLLTPEELARAGRYYAERDRRGFVFSRGQMRVLLALYCGVDAASLRFVTAPDGKPAIAPDQEFASRVSFNFTHSGGRALLAVSSGRELGLDLESHCRSTDVLALADRYFFEAEFAAILSSPEAERRASFFRYWTAKEAVIKAQGAGLGIPLNRFRVDPHLDSRPTPVQSLDASHVEPGWFVRCLPCEPEWSAALVAKGQDWTVTIRDPAK